MKLRFPSPARLLVAAVLSLLVVRSAVADVLDKTAKINGATVEYKVVLPKDYDPAKAYPGVLAFPGGGQAMPDGTKPQPGGWNRFMLELPDLATAVDALRKADAHFRNDIVTGVGGKQILLEDPSGNPIELFQPTLPEASLTTSR